MTIKRHNRHVLQPRTLVASIALALLALPASAANPGHATGSQALAMLGSPAPGASWKLDNELRNAQGRSVLHASQQYQGRRVWGSGSVVHVEPSGAPRMAVAGTTGTPAPKAAATLSAEQAIAIATKTLALKTLARPAKAELVVFPTRLQGGIAMTYSAEKKTYVIDRKMSVIGARPADDYVWAYQVQLLAKNQVDGYKDVSYVVDARTGAILNAVSNLRNLAAPNPPAQHDTDVAVKGIGHSQWSGIVSIDTTQRADGSFMMIDKTRGKKYIPFLHDNYMDYMTMSQIMDEDGQPISIVGIQAMAERHEGFDWDFNANWYWYANTTNEWGDGKPAVGYPYGNEESTTGQTAAVDAHYGMANTWDFYKNIFGREGVDGEGGSLVTIVHGFNFFGFPDVFAFYSADFGLVLGDGTINSRQNPQRGNEIPGDPNGRGAMTTVDIVGHELTHGLIAHTSNLDNYGEAGSIAEATGDIFGVLIRAYSKRAAGMDAVIPTTGVSWSLAEQNGLKPIRDLRQPSSIDYGRDNWYAGIEYTQNNFGSGVMNRAFYFMSQGASATAGAPDYSAYLPAGMSGVGNEHALRIWYKMLTEYLTPSATFADARSGALKAAADLYGSGSADVTAVRKAFGAVNVGAAVDGVEPIRIDFAIVHPAGSLFNPEGTGMSGAGTARMPIVPMAVTVQMGVELSGTTDKRVEYRLGAVPGSQFNPGFRHDGGTITADGAWTPNRDFGFHALTVVSKADPLQYAEGVAFVVDGDADSDTEFDAMDLGAVALSWGLNSPAKYSHSVLQDEVVSSFDVAAIVEAFKNAFGG
ncbi:MAG: M4 family metallopeptidase [Pseudomonadota bacterium]